MRGRSQLVKLEVSRGEDTHSHKGHDNTEVHPEKNNRCWLKYKLMRTLACD
jgi:hypothetical protein